MTQAKVVYVTAESWNGRWRVLVTLEEWEKFMRCEGGLYERWPYFLRKVAA